MERSSDAKRVKTGPGQPVLVELHDDNEDNTCKTIIEFDLISEVLGKRKPIQDANFDAGKKEHDAQRILEAKEALSYYNNKMGTDFDVEKMVDYAFMDNWYDIYIHMNFIGTCSKSPSPKLFFAEVVSNDNVVVNTCTIVEPGNPLFTIGCGGCHPDGLIYHPFSGYQAGHYKYTGIRSVHPSLALKKRDFWNRYTALSIIKVPDENEACDFIEKTTLFAENALESHNKFYGAAFKFVELAAAVRFVEETPPEIGLWLHVNFRATNERAEHSDSATELFFAEILVNLDRDYVSVSECDIVDPEMSDGTTQIGCGVCNSMYHSIGHSSGIQGKVLAFMDKSIFWIRKYELRREYEKDDYFHLVRKLPVALDDNF